MAVPNLCACCGIPMRWVTIIDSQGNSENRLECSVGCLCPERKP